MTSKYVIDCDICGAQIGDADPKIQLVVDVRSTDLCVKCAYSKPITDAINALQPPKPATPAEPAQPVTSPKP